jgi:polygalacturonase
VLNDGIGMRVRASKGVTVSGMRFHNLNRGAVFARSSDLRVSDNRVDTIRSDGFDFAGVQDVRIERNSFRNFFYSAKRRDHQDFIQFWFRNASPSSDVVIADNVMIEGRASSRRASSSTTRTARATCSANRSGASTSSTTCVMAPPHTGSASLEARIR